MIGKIKTNQEKSPERQIKNLIFFIRIVAFCCIVISLFDIGNVAMAAAYIDFPLSVVWRVLSISVIKNISLFASSFLILAIVRNLGRMKIFVPANANYIIAMALIVVWGGIAQSVIFETIDIVDMFSNDKYYQMYDFIEGAMRDYVFKVMIGVFMLIVGVIMKVGIRIKEENELTV